MREVSIARASYSSNEMISKLQIGIQISSSLPTLEPEQGVPVASERASRRIGIEHFLSIFAPCTSPRVVLRPVIVVLGRVVWTD